jgi:hypothetical protein
MASTLLAFVPDALRDRFLLFFLFLGHDLAGPDLQELAKLSIQWATERKVIVNRVLSSCCRASRINSDHGQRAPPSAESA